MLTAIKVKSKNLFDGSSNLVFQKYIDLDTGDIRNNPHTYYCETYFEIKPNTSYVFWGERKTDGLISNLNRIHFYDENKTFISTFNSSYNRKIVAVSPSTAKYVRISCYVWDSTTIETAWVVAQFNWYFGEGKYATEYEPYGDRLIPVTAARKVKSKNLFDKTEALKISNWVYTSGGNSQYAIEVEPNTEYTYHYDIQYIKDHPISGDVIFKISNGVENKPLWYSSNPSSQNATQTITSSSDGKLYLIEYGVSKDKLDGLLLNTSPMLNEGSTALPYEPYGDRLVSVYPTHKSELPPNPAI